MEIEEGERGVSEDESDAVKGCVRVRFECQV
jgi:hypothetical protein